jgi:uncharacterized protein
LPGIIEDLAAHREILVSEANRKLIIFVRAPRVGEVKTRLAAAMGSEGALAAYKVLLQTVLASLASLASVEVHYTPESAADEVRDWVPPHWLLRAQGSGDLGARMDAAFVEAFAGGAERVALIGSDCPTITVQDIEDAWATLTDYDLVLGPATDGGYWLIALRQAQPALFQGIPWSTGAVLRETRARAERVGLRVGLLRERADIDTEKDWQRFIRGNHGIRPQREN